tara:strand:+ start:161 stop:502 length:342 start_codon:yes stop_codon:yes gene_type:complete
MSNVEWWITPNGTNMLAGLDRFNEETGMYDNDPNNPANLNRLDIIEFLKTIPSARLSFNRLYPKMTADEKLRLDEIARASKFMVRNPKEVEDNFQKRMNTQGIYTTGKKGGGN